MSDSIFKTASYNPPHLFVTDTVYMLTASIYEKAHLMQPPQRKREWRDALHEALNGRQVWWNYRDTCTRSERDYYNRLRYVFWNPVKHRLVEKPEDYSFSNYREFLNQGFDFTGMDKVKDVLEF